MNLNQDNFKHNLISILNELTLHHNDKQKLYRYYISKRLNESLISYYEDLNLRVKQIEANTPEKILKHMRD